MAFYKFIYILIRVDDANVEQETGQHFDIVVDNDCHV